MTHYLLTLTIAAGVIVFFVYLFTFCRRRLRKTPHGLTGMCHRNGGTICPSCRDQDGKSSDLS